MQEKKSMLDSVMAKKDSFIVIRCDGRGFSKLKEADIFKKPYDAEVHKKIMKITASALKNLFRCGMAYVISDEISFVLPMSFNMFNRRIEKLLSISAGYLSGEGSLEFYELNIDPISFDAKIFEFGNIDEVLEYLNERKNYGFRNFIYTLLRDQEMKAGKTSNEVAKETNGKSISNYIEKLLKDGIDIYKMQYWKREGELLYFAPYVKEVKVGSFGARTKTQIVRRKLITEKPLRFCSNDRNILAKMIDADYVGD